jgi:hypothetical protein
LDTILKKQIRLFGSEGKRRLKNTIDQGHISGRYSHQGHASRGLSEETKGEIHGPSERLTHGSRESAAVIKLKCSTGRGRDTQTNQEKGAGDKNPLRDSPQDAGGPKEPEFESPGHDSLDRYPVRKFGLLPDTLAKLATHSLTRRIGSKENFDKLINFFNLFLIRQ